MRTGYGRARWVELLILEGPLDGKVLAVAHELAEVSRLVEREDVSAALERFVARIAHTVPGCDHATITVRSHGKVETVAGALPELVQAHGTGGAISEALEFREPRRIEDTVNDQDRKSVV